jgi:ABC-2 type transport system permease protein
MFRVEWMKALRRWRTYLIGAALAAIPIIMVIALKLSPPTGGGEDEGPPFLEQILSNGLFAALTGLIVIQPFFLPLATGLFAGDSVAGEAQGGTLRYLLIRPVPRPWLVVSKYAAAMTLLATMLALVAVAGVVAGGIVFGLHPIVTLSGTTLSMGESVLRMLGTVAYMVLAVSGLAALGVFISTQTDSGPGAAVATIIVAITSEILDNISSLHAIHRFLPTHGWQAFIGLFRTPVDWDPIRAGLTLSLAYTIVFLGAAVYRFSRRDIAG